MPAQTFELLATCTFGLESVVARELADLGYSATPIGVGRVLFKGDHRAIVDANLWLRAADRVLIRVGTFPVGGGDAGFDALFEGVRALPWEEWIAQEAAIPVAGRCVRSALSSEPAVQRTTKRAIVERLKKAYAKPGARSAEVLLPETGPKVAVEVSILKDVATLTIDTSGIGLHKRGYRAGTPGEAALKETMAAGLVLLSVWRPGRPLVDPFCGSGTIAIEAAMIGRNIAPGLNREFDAEKWEGQRGGRLLEESLWDEAREDALDAQSPERLDPVIHASDISEEALHLARMNARAAGVENDIQFLRRDFADLSTTKDYGVIITNPPYGVRLGDEREIERLYRGIPAVLRRLPTWSFHIFTGRLDLERLFGQEATRRRKMYNSKIECCYFSFLGPRPGGTSAAEARSFDQDDPGQGSDEPTITDDAEAAQELDDAPDQPGAASSTPVSAPVIAPVFGGLSPREEREAEDFGRCLASNLRHLRKYPSRGITCYRVYERDVPDVPLIIDRYEDRYHAVEYERPHSRSGAQQADWYDLMRRTIAQAADVPLANVYMKEKHRQHGLTQHEKVAQQHATAVVVEGGLKFEVNLSDYIDTGLFLDHRLTRQMVREQSAGKRVLNLFCYTGSFTVYAAAGGAAATTSVDLSNTYLDWARRNLEHNGLQGARHQLVRSDVLEFLRSHPRGAGVQYDLAVVDPPTFSNSKSTQQDWEVASRHGELLSLLAPLMSPGGVVYFSTNFRRFKFDSGAAAEAGFAARDISKQTVPPEYRNRRVHSCWVLRQVGRAEAVERLALAQRTAQAAADSGDDQNDGD